MINTTFFPLQSDVAVADKKDTNHLKNPFFKGAKGRDMPRYAHYFSLYLLSMKNVQNCKMGQNEANKQVGSFIFSVLLL